MFKKSFNYILIFIFICLQIWLIYNAIGYAILGYNTPKIIGQSNTTFFMGMYLMSITYGSISLVCFVIFIFAIYLYKKRKKSSIDNDFKK